MYERVSVTFLYSFAMSGSISLKTKYSFIFCVTSILSIALGVYQITITILNWFDCQCSPNLRYYLVVDAAIELLIFPTAFLLTICDKIIYRIPMITLSIASFAANIALAVYLLDSSLSCAYGDNSNTTLFLTSVAQCFVFFFLLGSQESVFGSYWGWSTDPKNSVLDEMATHGVA